MDGALIAHLYRQIDAFPFSALAKVQRLQNHRLAKRKSVRITKSLGASSKVSDVDRISKGGADGGAERAGGLDFRRIKQGAAGITTAAPHIADQWGRGDDRLPGLRETPGLVPIAVNFFNTRLSDNCFSELSSFAMRYPVDRHGAGGRTVMAILSSGISKGIFGAAVLSLTFGAVAWGRDLVQHNAVSPSVQADAGTSASVNRGVKADRAALGGSALQTRTVALRLNDLAGTSVLIRIPALREIRNEARSNAPASLLIKSGENKPTIACEPAVSVLTEVAKRLRPGRCVT
jgi:hypothetical protein